MNRSKVFFSSAIMKILLIVIVAVAINISSIKNIQTNLLYQKQGVVTNAFITAQS